MGQGTREVKEGKGDLYFEIKKKYCWSTQFRVPDFITEEGGRYSGLKISKFSRQLVSHVPVKQFSFPLRDLTSHYTVTTGSKTRHFQVTLLYRIFNSVPITTM